MKNWTLIICSFLLWSCSESEEPQDKIDTEVQADQVPKGEINCWISGQISGAANQPISLAVVSEQGELKLASTHVGTDGSFSLDCHVLGLGMYQLQLGLTGDKVAPLTLVPGDKVSLTATFENFERLPKLSGTSWAKPLSDYMVKFNDFAQQQVELSKQQGKTQEEQIATFLEMRKPLDAYARAEMKKDPSNPVNLVLMTSLTPVMGFENWEEKNLEVLAEFSKAFQAKYADSPMAKSVKQQVDQIDKGWKDYKLTVSGNKEAPEIDLLDPNGKKIKLSSLRGQVVLIDFWASWCAPCRRENPNVVRMYKQYKSKGFTVYSVSLDADPAAWKRAIEADGLIWPNHVSDLKQWDTPLTQLYGFNSIPHTVLLDRKGKIIATNLRGEKLEQKLKEIL